jgi:hypothetical protein
MRIALPQAPNRGEWVRESCGSLIGSLPTCVTSVLYEGLSPRALIAPAILPLIAMPLSL